MPYNDFECIQENSYWLLISVDMMSLASVNIKSPGFINHYVNRYQKSIIEQEPHVVMKTRTSFHCDFCLIRINIPKKSLKFKKRSRQKTNYCVHILTGFEMLSGCSGHSPGLPWTWITQHICRKSVTKTYYYICQ